MSATPLFPGESDGANQLSLLQFLTTKSRGMYPHIFTDGVLLEPASATTDDHEHRQMQFVSSFYPRSENAACRTEYVLQRDFTDDCMRMLPVQRSVEYEPQVQNAVVSDDDANVLLKHTTFVTEWAHGPTQHNTSNGAPESQEEPTPREDTTDEPAKKRPRASSE